MPTLLLATKNAGKVRELAAMLASRAVEVQSLADFPDYGDVVEDTGTFVGNATKKAVTAAMTLGVAALADDSGLVVEALGGDPGVDSAYYGGPDLSDPQRCELVLARLAEQGLTSSPAHFVCVMVLATPDGRQTTCQAIWEGRVCGPPRGGNGFGYDPIFEPEGGQGTSAMLSAEVKNRLSHRGQALAAMVARIESEPELLGD